MDVTQMVVTLLGGGTLAIISKSLIEQWGLNRQSKAKERRRETDRADEAERDNRILKESLAVHRRIIIDAPCLGPSHLPEWPTTHSIRSAREDG